MRGDGDGTFVIALINPGNSFPVTEKPDGDQGYRDKPVRSGYQSHYALGENSPFFFPKQSC